MFLKISWVGQFPDLVVGLHDVTHFWPANDGNTLKQPDERESVAAVHLPLQFGRTRQRSNHKLFTSALRRSGVTFALEERQAASAGEESVGWGDFTDHFRSKTGFEKSTSQHPCYAARLPFSLHPADCEAMHQPVAADNYMTTRPQRQRG